MMKSKQWSESLLNRGYSATWDRQAPGEAVAEDHPVAFNQQPIGGNISLIMAQLIFILCESAGNIHSDASQCGEAFECAPLPWKRSCQLILSEVSK
eukprot:scaffold401984_cov48-Prasinocladus_malaysianus.AAC.1